MLGRGAETATATGNAVLLGSAGVVATFSNFRPTEKGYLYRSFRLFYATLLSASECKSERRRGRFRGALWDGVSNPFFANNATIACGSITPKFRLTFAVLGP